MSLFCPPAGLSPHLAILWPLIWAQILMARASVRVTYGKGTLYRMRVAPWGQVFIEKIEWIPGGDAPAPTLPALVAKSHARIAALTDGSMLEPAYALNFQLSAHPSESRGPERHATHVAAPDPGLRRETRLWGLLPLPET